MEEMLQAINNILLTNWGTQNLCQVIVFTDCGSGFGATSLTNTISNVAAMQLSQTVANPAWFPFSSFSRLNFVCLGIEENKKFKKAASLYQQLLDVSKQKGNLYIPKSENEHSNVLTPKAVLLNVERMCESNFKAFEATLKCGGDFRLEGPVTLWPSPMPYTCKDSFGVETTRSISRRLEVCGYVSISDIGSPMSISRHLIVPTNKDHSLPQTSLEENFGSNQIEKLDTNLKSYFSRTEMSDDEDASGSRDSCKESVCVLLHGALKQEQMAALVLLNDNWFGFLYTYSDGKKRSNLMLIVLPPGHDAVPWLGDLRCLGFKIDLPAGETPLPAVKMEKRSYSQNCVVWIKQNGLQSDIQKMMRHARKLPEKTQHFYKELNRLRRAALSLGFVELLEGMSLIFEREINNLSATANPDCSIQLNHSIVELRKVNNRDLKTLITPLPSQYNLL